MTLTDSRTTETDTALATVSVERAVVTAPQAQAQGFTRSMMAADAVTVGRLFVAMSLLAGLGTAVIGLLNAVERLDTVSPTDVFGGLNSYFQMWTLYRVSFVLLVVMPLLLGIAMLVVPTQIGADNLAFPRAALGAFWLWRIGAVITVASVFAGGGWGAIDGVTAKESDAIALTLLGTATMIVALLLGAVVVATTIVTLRPAGMSLLAVPAFVWSMLVTCAVWLFTMPAVIANIVLIYADLRGRPAVAYGRAEGPDIWLQLDWVIEQPAVYAMAIPVIGVAVDTVVRAVGVGPGRPELAAIVVGLFGLLAVGGWSQDYFTQPADYRDDLIYVAFGLGAVVPVVAALGLTVGLVFQGQKNAAQLTSPRFLGAVSGLLMLLGAVVIGALRVIDPLDLLDTTANSAVFSAVVLAALTAAAAALWQWAPPLAKRDLSRAQGRALMVLLLAAGILLALPELISGLEGTSDFAMGGLEVNDVGPGDLDGVLSAVALSGSVLLVLAMLLLLRVAVASLRAAFSAKTMQAKTMQDRASA